MPDGFWGPLYAGVTIAAISGLAWLAFMHPRTYFRVFMGLFGISVVVGWTNLLLDVGFWMGADAATSLARKAVDSAHIKLVLSSPPAPAGAWGTVYGSGIAIAVLVGLLVLSWVSPHDHLSRSAEAKR